MFLAMHIPDGFLSVPTGLALWVVTACVVGAALSITREQLKERQIPLLGMMGAFIFAAQALNFPIAGGTSGHLLGATLATIVLGPWAATLVMTSVIATQGLLFADGGLLSMGANIFNMGILGAFLGYALYRDLQRLGLPEHLATLIAAWISVVAAATACSLELALSGTTRLDVVLPAMVGVHLFLGLGEGVVTVAAVRTLKASNLRYRLVGQHASTGEGGSVTPDLPPAATGARVLGWGMLVSLVLCLLSPLASTAPDGLARVAERTGFSKKTRVATGIFANYHVPFLNGGPSIITAMVTGTALIGAVALCLGYILTRSRQHDCDENNVQAAP